VSGLIGAVLVCVALFASVFATSIIVLIFTLGAVLGKKQDILYTFICMFDSLFCIIVLIFSNITIDDDVLITYMLGIRPCLPSQLMI